MKNATGQTDWNDYAECPCGSAAGQPCQTGSANTTELRGLRHWPHTDRPRAGQPDPKLTAEIALELESLEIADQAERDRDTDPRPLYLEPGPMWTNGLAPAAAPVMIDIAAGQRREPCPVWCTRHEHGMQTSEPHTLELLNLAVLDTDLTTDVPLQLAILQDLEPDARPAVHLEIGHQLYQPTGVSLSRSDRARLAAMLLVANELTQK